MLTLPFTLLEWPGLNDRAAQNEKAIYSPEFSTMAHNTGLFIPVSVYLFALFLQLASGSSNLSLRLRNNSRACAVFCVVGAVSLVPGAKYMLTVIKRWYKLAEQVYL